MDHGHLSELRGWLTEAGLAGTSETLLLDGFCRRALDAGLPLARALIIIDTLHPVHEGRAFFWCRDEGRSQTRQVEYGPSGEGEAAETWHRSVLFHLRETGGSLYRRAHRLAQPSGRPDPHRHLRRRLGAAMGRRKAGDRAG